MQIAIVNSFPNVPFTAEREFLARFRKAAKAIGHHTHECATSDEINWCQPDFVISTHEFTPKLTEHLTLGAMWSPPTFFEGDPYRVRSVLSYDGYLVGSEFVRRFIEDLEFSSGITKPKSGFLFLPSARKTKFSIPRSRQWDLVYIGVHWDGLRHKDILSGLHQAGALNVYGPSAGWSDYAGCYRGSVPYDGASVIRVLSKHGVALCLHKEEHLAADTPSMRLFEAAAASCVIIVDDIPFARRLLKDAVFYVDTGASGEEVVEVILDHLRWIRANPKGAVEMAQASHAILSREFGLERLVAQCCTFAQDILERNNSDRSTAVSNLARNFGSGEQLRTGTVESSHQQEALVDIIVRAGGRPLQTVKRALRSIARQDFGTYRVLIVDYKGREDLTELPAAESTHNMQIRYFRSADTGLRSTATWTGLRNVSAPFFALLDDDDEIMVSHFSSLLGLAAERPQYGFIYSGVIRVEEESAVSIEPPNFKGPLDRDLMERRELKFLDAHDMGRLLAFDNYIQSNTWICRREILDGQILKDPQLVVMEDLYFYLLIASKTDFLCSYRPTAFWNWRSSSNDNSMASVGQKIWVDAAATISRRLRLIDFKVPHRIAAAPRKHESAVKLIRRPSEVFKLCRGVPANFSRETMSRIAHVGFHPPEEEGTWTSGDDSVMCFDLEQPLQHLDLKLTLMACPLSDHSDRTVVITINDTTFFEGTLPSWTTIELQNSVTFLDEEDKLKIRIRSDMLTIPRELKISEDPRLLGVLCRSILIVAPIAT